MRPKTLVCQGKLTHHRDFPSRAAVRCEACKASVTLLSKSGGGGPAGTWYEMTSALAGSFCTISGNQSVTGDIGRLSALQRKTSKAG
jgi:hypothetical protein